MYTDIGPACANPVSSPLVYTHFHDGTNETRLASGSLSTSSATTSPLRYLVCLLMECELNLAINKNITKESPNADVRVMV